MTLTLKHFIHQVFILCWWEVNFVFFAIFGLGKVLWFCVTKVSGKNQSYSNLYWFCKNLQIGTKSGEKNQVGKISKRPKIPRNYKIFRIEKIQFPVCKGILVHFLKVLLCKSLTVLIELLLNCILHVYVKLCTNRAFGRVKRYKTISGT